MENDLIPIEGLCAGHNIDISFILLLEDHGLADVITIEEQRYVHTHQLLHIEKMIRLHYELEINLEGIEAISNLLERINLLQEELSSIKKRLYLNNKADL